LLYNPHKFGAEAEIHIIEEAKDYEENGSPINKAKSPKEKDLQSFAHNSSIRSVNDSGQELLKVQQIKPTK
jgi:hypothetical protein